MRRAVSYYWAMVTCIDDHIGKIVEVLQRKGILDDTMIIYTSDHGEMLGERGRMGKGVFYDTVIRVPLIVKPPAGAPCRAGDCAQLTEVMNIAPTVLDYAGIPIPDNMAAHSLRASIESGADGTEMIFCEYVDNNRQEYGKCVRTASHKYIKWFASGREEFFDLSADPLEQKNLAPDGAQKGEMWALKDAMNDWLARTEWRHLYASPGA
jgi:arylsulfatase A-like enzyme